MTEIAAVQDTLELSGGGVAVEKSEQWLPKLFPKQIEILNDTSKILLLNGGRFTGKSVALAHKCMKCAWLKPEANIVIVVSSYKVATDGGTYQDILNAAKEWAASGIESEYGYTFEITSIMPNGEPGSKVDAKNRTPFFTIRNQYGGNSTIRLFSIDNENEIEKKMKGTRVTMIWLVELSNFKSREVLRICYFQLRSGFDPVSNTIVEESDLQLVADTNPAMEGKLHWIYKLFYEHDSGTVPEEHRGAVERMAKKMRVIEVSLEDNTFCPKDKEDELIAMYAGDPHNFKRFVLGEWPSGPKESSVLFADVFSEELIIPDAIDVDPLTETLYCGWDPGYVNHGWCLLEKRIVAGQFIWCALDEIVHLGSYVSIQDFALEVLERLVKINEFYQKKWKNFKGFKFVHWSDSSCFIPNLNDEGGTQAVEIYNATNGQIELTPCDKPAKSVESGCQMIRKLMRENRFFVGSNCPQMIDMFQNIKRPSKGAQTIDPNDKRKHLGDAVRYPIFAEQSSDLMNDPLRPKQRDNRTIRISM